MRRGAAQTVCAVATYGSREVLSMEHQRSCTRDGDRLIENLPAICPGI